MTTKSQKPVVRSADSVAEIRTRVEYNELRAREFESQARILEARMRLVDVQKKFRESFPAVDTSELK